MADVNIDSIFGGGGGGPYLTDPLEMIRGQFRTAYHIYIDSTNASHTYNFWHLFTGIGSYGAVTPTVKKTFVDVAGRGKLFGMIGPDQAGGPLTTTWEVIVDGVTSTFTTVQPGGTNRHLVGDCFEAGSAFTITRDNSIGGATVRSNNAQWPGAPSATIVIKPPDRCLRPLKFSTGLKVSVTTTTNDGSAYYQNGGAIWGLDQI